MTSQRRPKPRARRQPAPQATNPPCIRHEEVGAAVLQALLEHMPCIVLTVDEAHRIRYINRVPRGLTVESVIGRSCLDFVVPGSRQVVRDALNRVLHSGRTTGYEVQAQGPDGALAWYSTKVLPLRDGTDGAKLALLTEDVTERHRLDSALRSREAQLRAVVDETTDAVHVKDESGRYVLVNPALCRLAGRQAEAILGRDDSAFLEPRLASEVMEEDRRVMASGEIITLQFSVTQPGGEQRTLHATKGPLRDASGAVIGVFGIARDITQILRQENAQRQALEESRNLLELTLGAAELGIWDADLVTGSVYRDDRLLSMLGYTRDELKPTLDQWWDLIHPEDRAAVETSRQAHLDGLTRTHESEHRLRHREGHWIWVFESGKAQRDAAGRPVRAIGITRDISDRRRAANESVELLRRVEELISTLGRNSRPTLSAVAKDMPGPDERLTERGRQVLALLARGLTSSQIAQRLGISEETASTHRRNLMRRLGLRNKAELIRYALEHGIGGDPAEGR